MSTYHISGIYDQHVHSIPRVLRLLNVRYMDEPADRTTGEVEETEEAEQALENSKEMQAAWLKPSTTGNGSRPTDTNGDDFGDAYENSFFFSIVSWMIPSGDFLHNYHGQRNS